MICSEARLAIRNGVDLKRVCIYPVYGLSVGITIVIVDAVYIQLDEAWSGRSIRSDLAEELVLQDHLFAGTRRSDNAAGPVATTPGLDPKSSASAN